MSGKTRHVKIGAFVLGGLALLVGAIALIGSGRLFRKTYAFVSYFDGSVNGLRAGAAVKFKGVELGKVDRVRIPFRVDKNDQPIAVFYSLDGDKLEDGRGSFGAYADTLNGAIQNGLRAQLEADSLLTGVQHVSLLFTDEKKVVLHDLIEGAIEIPTIPPPMQELGSSLRTVVDKIGRYDFEKLFASLHAALDSIHELARLPELKSALTSLGGTLRSVEAAMATLEKRIDPLATSFETAASSVARAGNDVGSGVESLKVTLDSVKRLTDELGNGMQPLLTSLKTTSDGLQTLSSELERSLATTRILLDPEAPIAVELRATLRGLQDTARSTRALFEYLERDPSALVRGRIVEDESPR